MSLQDLYQQVIIDHGRHPRNFGVCEHCTHQHQGYNPLCGDQVTVFIYLDKDIVKDITFNGAGCAISVASASLMTEALKGKTVAQVQEIFENFRQTVTTGEGVSQEKLGKLTVLAGVAEYPMRVKCATLAWHALMNALPVQRTEDRHDS